MSNPERAYTLWKNTIPVLINEETLRTAEQRIDACEACAPDHAEIPFDHVLDCITGCNPEVTDYVLAKPARCPRCSGAVHAAYWRWHTSEPEGRKVFILPATLVTLKKE